MYSTFADTSVPVAAVKIDAECSMLRVLQPSEDIRGTHGAGGGYSNTSNTAHYTYKKHVRLLQHAHHAGGYALAGCSGTNSMQNAARYGCCNHQKMFSTYVGLSACHRTLKYVTHSAIDLIASCNAVTTRTPRLRIRPSLSQRCNLIQNAACYRCCYHQKIFSEHMGQS
jgi:hypothetical protein